MLAQQDPVIASWCQKELLRQETHLELIASENYVSPAVLEAQGSILTNKYAEGYPGKRYYGGCEYVDEIELLAQERACQLFEAEFANVQPHSGSQANFAVFAALLKPGDRFLGMNLADGGHLTHGSPVSLSGKWFECFSYGIHPTTGQIDYDQIKDLAKKHRPKLLVAGASAYPRLIDFKILGEIAKETGMFFMADIAHIAGLVATGLHPSPIPHATYTTSTTHKTLRGPRGGLVLCRASEEKAIRSAVFPGCQGGPLMHVIAAKAVAFEEALQPSFKVYQKQILKNAQALAQGLLDLGYSLVTGGTDNHLLLVHLGESRGTQEISGKQAELWLGQAQLTVNKNAVPRDERTPALTSGIRLGTPALTTRGMKESEMQQVAQWIHRCLTSQGDHTRLQQISKEVQDLCRAFPVYLAPSQFPVQQESHASN